MSLRQDVRYALRGLRRSPGFTAVAVLTLALGIGANTAMFSVLNAVLLRPLPYPAPDHLAMLWTEQPNQHLRVGRSAYRDVEEWRRHSRSFTDMAVFDPVSVMLTAPGEITQISVVRTSPNLFALLGVQPVRGRLFSTEEADQRHRVALISHHLWQTRFGGADAAIGSTVDIDGRPSEVIGILPASFTFAGANAEVWEPHTLFPDWEQRKTGATASSWFVLGRTPPGVTIQQAQTELSALAPPGGGISVMPLSLHLVGAQPRVALWMLMGAVFCVLLIGISNITSLSLARSASRGREIAIRSALGATSGRIIRQLLAESLTLAFVSGLAGLVVAMIGIPLIVALKPGDLPLDHVGVDAPVLAWTLGLTVLTGLLVGLVPAITAGRVNLRPVLQDGERGSSAGHSTRLTRRALVVVEFALAIMLLTGAGLLTRSLLHVQSVDPGFIANHVVSMQLSLPASVGADERVDYYRQVLEHVQAVGGVQNAGVIGDLFIGGASEQIVTVEGSHRGVPDRLRLRRDEVSSGLFATLRIPLLRGRVFSSEDGPQSPRVAIINATMARQLWAQQDPIGRRFKFGQQDSNGAWFTVVGLVGDVRRENLENNPGAQMFEPLPQNPSRLATLLIRTSTDPLAMVNTLKAAIREVDTRAPLYGVTTLTDRLLMFQAERRFQTSLLIAFSLVALLLAGLGIYGVIQYSIATRTREIGVRLAVGAQRGDIFQMIVAEGLKLSFTGLALGLAGALMLGRLGSSLLFGVTATDPTTYVAVSLVLTFVAAVACYFPARRASRVDPLTALRYE